LRGEAYSWLKKYKPAVNDLTTYIKKHPDDIQAHKLRADAYGWLGQARSQKYDEWRIKQLQKQTGN
jgi:TolA-binding protein